MFGFFKKDAKKNVAAEVQKTVAPETVEVPEIIGNDAGVTTEPQPQKCSEHHFNSFYETRTYLRQIRDSKHHIKLLEYRKGYRWNANLDTKKIEDEIDSEEAKVVGLRVEISDEISKLKDARQEWVMTRRYVDCLSWEQIALDMDVTVRTVQKLHGKALPLMEIILIEDGKIVVEVDDSKAAVVAAKVQGYKEQYAGDYGCADTDTDVYPYPYNYRDSDEEEAHEYFND